MGGARARCSSSATRRSPLHAEVGAEVVARGVDELVVVGPDAAPLAAGARAATRAGRGRDGIRLGRPAPCGPECARGRRTSTPPSVLLRDELRPGDVVLFKSSRDAGLRLLGDRLAGPREEHA